MTYRKTKVVYAVASDDDSEQPVAEDPYSDESRSETLVRILQRLLRLLLRCYVGRKSSLDGLLELRINIRLR